jgi:enoyl-CoA hydratase/2-(1,2-epoxy-1,2-dihydrophenyl)acetyl-CoA isomerase
VSSFDTIRFDRDEHIGTLTLARPEKHNAQNPRMWDELRRLGDDLLGDRTLRCLVVIGEGPSFSAGLDLVEGLAGAIAEAVEEAAGDTDSADRPLDEHLVDAALVAAGTFTWIPQLPCPSIAAVHGHALGAGFQLALACDFRILARSARLGLTETRYALLPDMGATIRLPRLVGDGVARELILLGDIIDAEHAARIGLANHVVGDDQLRDAAFELAGRVAAQPPLAMTGARRAIQTGWFADAEAGLRTAVKAQLRCLLSEDFQEARRALLNDRPPTWRGR